MKHIIISIAAVIFAFTTNAQVNYNNNSLSGTYASAIGENNDVNGNHSFVGGVDSEANGLRTFAFGNNANALANNAIALGHSITSNGVESVTLGMQLTANGTNSFVIGKGITSSYRLVNDIPNSLMIGMNATKPTLFISPTYGLDKTGKIGIGNVTDPQAKLHIKGDTDEYTPEDADLLLEPGSAGNFARIMFGTAGNIIDAKDSLNLNFHTASGFVFWDANVGIGTDSPQAKLQITDGDIFIEDIDRGIIMKSPDGQCWRGTLDNNGSLNFNIIDCNLVTGTTKNDNSVSNEINVFPNPSNGYIIVKSKCNRCNFVVSLFDMKGNTVLKKEMKTGQMKLKTAGLPTGYYSVRVLSTQGQNIYTEKVLVL